MPPWLPETYYLINRLFFGVFCLLAAIAITGLIVLLVRFLLVATRAAQIYVAKNEPPAPVIAPPAHQTTPAYSPTREHAASSVPEPDSADPGSSKPAS